MLTSWAQDESAYFLCEFWKSLGMSEMQFYKRMWKAEKEIEGFDLGEIKKILRHHRWIRDNQI